MSRVSSSIDVDRPLGTVYGTWTNFESFPHFMKGVEQVVQLDDQRSHWVAEIAGQHREWDAVIQEDVRDSHITWQGFGDVDNVGTVAFEQLSPETTRVTTSIEFEPSGALEKTADALGLVEGRVRGDLERFKEYIEDAAAEKPTGAARTDTTSGVLDTTMTEPPTTKTDERGDNIAVDPTA